jgi:hypothetical protein
MEHGVEQVVVLAVVRPVDRCQGDKPDPPASVFTLRARNIGLRTKFRSRFVGQVSQVAAICRFAVHDKNVAQEEL